MSKVMHQTLQIALLEVSDIAFEIAIRLDNDSLRKLSALPLWSLFQTVIASHSGHFWYRRTEFKCGASLQSRLHVLDEARSAVAVDWKCVYYTAHDAPLSYLPSLLVSLESGYDLSLCTSHHIWTSISSPDVLSYLVAEQLVTTTLSDISDCLISAVQNGRTEMILPLITLVRAKHGDERSTTVVFSAGWEALKTEHLDIVQLLYEQAGDVDPHAFLSHTSSVGHPDVILWLLSKCSDESCVLSLIRRAISRGQTGLVSELMSRLEPAPSYLDMMLDYAIREGRVEVAELLRELGAGSSSSSLNWPDLILDVVRDAKHLDVKPFDGPPTTPEQVIAYVLSIAPVDQLPSELLSIAAGRGETIFRLVLSDRRLDPVADLTQTLRVITGVQNLGEVMSSACLSTARRSDSGLGLILALVRCERFRTEKLNVPALRLVLWSLYSVIWPKIEGFCEGGRRAGGGTTPRQLSDLLELESALALVARYLLIKNPTSTELCDAMIERQEPLFEIAARHVLSSKLITDNSELVTIEALLLALLYTTLTLSDVIQRLVLGGVAPRARVHAGRLLGLWFARQTGSE